MGSRLELNDTLQLTVEQGFPVELLELARHEVDPIPLEAVSGREFEFFGKPGIRFFQADPVPVRLVHNIGGKWLYWARVLIQRQSIGKILEADGTWTEDRWATSGAYRIVDLYDPPYQRLFTLREAPAGLSYFTAQT